jgi:hypothetical protein
MQSGLMVQDAAQAAAHTQAAFYSHARVWFGLARHLADEPSAGPADRRKLRMTGWLSESAGATDGSQEALILLNELGEIF